MTEDASAASPRSRETIVYAISELWWMLIAVGFGAGILSGLFGVGGGILMVPALVLVLAMPQQTAQGTALAVMVPMALLGAWRYYGQPELGMSLRVIALISVGALAGTLLGTRFALRLPPAVLTRMFAVFVIIVAIRMLIAPTPAKRATPQPDKPEHSTHH